MGASGLEELLGYPPGGTSCTYTTSDTSKGPALFFFYEHLNVHAWDTAGPEQNQKVLS